jgi:hypothetical protein
MQHRLAASFASRTLAYRQIQPIKTPFACYIFYIANYHKAFYICYMNTITRFFVFILVFLSVAAAAKDHSVIKRPEYILVQLSTEMNRMRKLEAHGTAKEVARLKKDLAGIYNVMRNDFQDHFNFCPVYFFFDTSLTEIKNHNFHGNVFSINGSALPDGYLTGDNYQIVYYGYPVERLPHLGYLPEQTNETNFTTKFGRVWVVCDKNYEQVSYAGRISTFDKGAEYLFDSDYRFVSKKFDLEYFPGAVKLEEVFAEMAP